MILFFFFFQAEDGIRDDLVTGVQTCALPISHLECFEFVQIKNILNEPTPMPTVFAISSPTPIPATPTSTSISTITPTPKIIVITPSPQAITKITYVPLSGGSTQNTDWTNINSSQFTLNISDYGTN